MGTYAAVGWNFHGDCWKETQKGTAAGNFFWAAFFYAVCFGISIYFIVQQKKLRGYRRGVTYGLKGN